MGPPKDNGLAFCRAVRDNSVDTAKQELAAGADVCSRVREFDYLVPIAIAAKYGNVEMTEFLFGVEGVDPEWTGRDEFPPLSMASYHGYEEVVKLYLANPRVDPTRRGGLGRTALAYAALQRHPKAVELLLRDERVDPTVVCSDGRTPFLHAASQPKNNTEVMKILLSNRRVDFNVADRVGLTALHLAVHNGNAEHVRLLLDAGADVSARDSDAKTPINSCPEESNTVLELLLAAPGVDPNDSDDFGRTLLMDAANRGDTAVVFRLLADERVLPNLRDKEGMTAVAIAARRGYPEPLSLLLALEDIDLNVRTGHHQCILSLAIESENDWAVDVLLGDERVETRYTDSDGYTPFLRAALAGDADMLRVIYDSRRCSLFDRDPEGRNAWSLVDDDNEEAVEVLLEIQDEAKWTEE